MPDAAAFPPAGPALIDPFGRRVTYLRLSVTDRCDFRCVYCMDPNQRFAPRERVLGLEELLAVTRVFVGLGIRKVRLTGGEPLVRPNLIRLMRGIQALPGLDELVITTNGSQLAARAQEIRDAGVRRINISLDSLRPARFRQLTRQGDLAQVLAGIDAAIAAGFERIKLNTVILGERNGDEILDLVRFALDKGINLSFIEEMPVGEVADRPATFYSSERIRAEIEPHFTLIPTTETTGGPARYFRIPGSPTRVGFISPHSHNFCADCNRVRVTTEGQLLLCLGREESLDLRAILRRHPGDDERLRQAIITAMRMKPAGHRFETGVPAVIGRRMNVTGG
jgi:cyclic pyranopterin phosphate synthase